MSGRVKPLEEQIQKGQAIKLYQDIELQFQGSQLESLQEFDASKLTESAETLSEDQKTKAKLVTQDGKRKLLVTVEGIHTGMTKNMTFYPGNTLEESIPTWTNPHRKPVLKNHNVSTEPLGRILNSEYVQSTLTDNYTLRMQLEVTDQDAIEKVLDGRYLTLSVGGSANKVTCSVCAKDLVSEGFCGHYRGRKYEEKTAHWIIGKYTGDEISFVNMPADVYSQVIASELDQEGGNNMSAKTKSNESATEPNNVPVNESDDDLDIDGILSEADKGKKDPKKSDGDKTKKPEDGDKTKSKDGSKSSDDDEEDKKKKKKKESNDDPAQTSESIEELQLKLDEANGRIQTLEQDLEKANNDNVSLEATMVEKDEEISTLTTQVAEATQNLEVAESERDTFKKQNLSLAKFARRSLAERVADIRIMQGKNTGEDREELVEEWSSSTVKVLQSTITDLLKSNGQRQQAKVTSPGLAVKDNNSTFVGDDGEEIQTKESEKPKRRTLGDLAESMVGYMSKSNY